MSSGWDRGDGRVRACIGTCPWDRQRGEGQAFCAGDIAVAEVLISK